MPTKPNKKYFGSDERSYTDHHHPNHTIISMCSDKNKTSKMAACQTEVDLAEPREYRKYSEYALQVDDQQDDKAVEIKLCSLAKPHMMAFHCSWWGFFMAFFYLVRDITASDRDPGRPRAHRRGNLDLQHCQRLRNDLYASSIRSSLR